MTDEQLDALARSEKASRESFSSADAAGTIGCADPEPTGWVEFHLLDDNDQGVGNARYRLRLPDGTEHRGRLDASGKARREGIEQGQCSLGFIDLDRDAWSALGSSTPTDAVLPPDLAHSDVRHEARAGDCISSIADAYGHFWPTLWDHPGNKALREHRADPDLLVEGDVVVVPALRFQEVTCATGHVHRFRRKGIPAMFRLALRTPSGEPLPDHAYLLTIDGVTTSGSTGAAARVEHPIPPGARSGELVLYDAQRQAVATIRFALGHMEPVDTEDGVAARLANLGFDPGQTEQERAEAIGHFQLRHLGEDRVTGTLDEPTRAKLAELYDAPASE